MTFYHNIFKRSMLLGLGCLQNDTNVMCQQYYLRCFPLRKSYCRTSTNGGESTMQSVPLIDGGTVRLPRLIGLSRALDMILTGRPVGAQEALRFGLANKVVPDGQALEAALELADQISSFPQQCLCADRSSAFYSAFDAATFQEAMQFEMNGGMPVIQSESVPGASKFVAGTGKGGTFTKLCDQ